MKLLPTLWGNKEAKKETTVDSGEIVVVQQTALTKPTKNGQVVRVRKKSITIAGEKIDLDPKDLMRMIKQITRTIGEYKAMDNPLSKYVTPSIRSTRDKMVSDLSHHFGISWELDEAGNSIFSI